MSNPSQSLQEYKRVLNQANYSIYVNYSFNYHDLKFFFISLKSLNIVPNKILKMHVNCLALKNQVTCVQVLLVSYHTRVHPSTSEYH